MKPTSKFDFFSRFYDFGEFTTFWPHKIYPISQMMTAKAQRVRVLLTFVLEAFFKPKLFMTSKKTQISNPTHL